MRAHFQERVVSFPISRAWVNWGDQHRKRPVEGREIGDSLDQEGEEKKKKKAVIAPFDSSLERLLLIALFFSFFFSSSSANSFLSIVRRISTNFLPPFLSYH